MRVCTQCLCYTAYQADLLKELDEREQVSSDDIAELRRTADLSLRSTKETARAIWRSMAAMVAAERHLWLTLSDMNTKTGSAYWTPRFSSSGLFGDAVNSVVDRFQEASKQAAAFRRFLPRRSRAQGLLGSSPRRVPAPHTGRLKRRALPLALPHGGARSKRYSSGTSRSKPDLRSVLTARRSQKKKSWHMGVQDFWGQAPLGKKGVTVPISPQCPRRCAQSDARGLRHTSPLRGSING